MASPGNVGATVYDWALNPPTGTGDFNVVLNDEIIYEGGTEDTPISLTIQNRVRMTNDGLVLIRVGDYSTLDFGGGFNLEAQRGFTKQGAGTLVLSSTTQRYGRFNVLEGTLLITAAAEVIGASSVVSWLGPAGLYINGGTVVLASETPGGSARHFFLNAGSHGSSASFQLESGTFNLNGRNESIDGHSILKGGLIKGDYVDPNNGAVTVGTLTLTSYNTLQKQTTATTTLQNVNLATSRSFSIAGGIALDNATFTQNGGTLSFADTSSGFSGTGTITKVNAGALNYLGGGVLTLTNTSAYAGGTRIVGGTVNFDNAASFGTGTVTVDGGTLQWASGTSSVLASAFVLDAGGVTFDTNGNGGTISGGISGTGALTKVGGGTLTLGAVNSYAGKTSVEGGTLALAVGASLGTSTEIEITNGGTLSLASAKQIGRATNVTINGGTLATAENLGALFDDTFTPNGILDVTGGRIEINGTLNINTTGAVLFTNAELAFTPDNSGLAQLVIATGSLNANSTADIVYNGDLSAGNELVIIGVAEGVLKSWNLNGTVIDGNYALTSESGGFSITPIPEPSTYALFGGLGALALTLLRRRRKA